VTQSASTTPATSVTFKRISLKQDQGTTTHESLAFTFFPSPHTQKPVDSNEQQLSVHLPAMPGMNVGHSYQFLGSCRIAHTLHTGLPITNTCVCCRCIGLPAAQLAMAKQSMIHKRTQLHGTGPFIMHTSVVNHCRSCLWIKKAGCKTVYCDS
jgi:hypothetical protein